MDWTEFKTLLDELIEGGPAALDGRDLGARTHDDVRAMLRKIISGAVYHHRMTPVSSDDIPVLAAAACAARDAVWPGRPDSAHRHELGGGAICWLCLCEM